jgi:hypothetical protein
MDNGQLNIYYKANSDPSLQQLLPPTNGPKMVGCSLHTLSACTLCAFGPINYIVHTPFACTHVYSGMGFGRKSCAHSFCRYISANRLCKRTVAPQVVMAREVLRCCPPESKTLSNRSKSQLVWM